MLETISADVTITPITTPGEGKFIHYRIHGVMWCERGKCYAHTEGVYTVEDLTWRSVFGSLEAAEKFYSNGAPIDMFINLWKLGYDPCDVLVKNDKGDKDDKIL